MPFEFRPLEISDVILISSKIFKDERGEDLGIWKGEEYKEMALCERLRRSYF